MLISCSCVRLPTGISPLTTLPRRACLLLRPSWHTLVIPKFDVEQYVISPNIKASQLAADKVTQGISFSDERGGVYEICVLCLRIVFPGIGSCYKTRTCSNSIYHIQRQRNGCLFLPGLRPRHGLRNVLNYKGRTRHLLSRSTAPIPRRTMSATVRARRPTQPQPSGIRTVQPRTRRAMHCCRTPRITSTGAGRLARTLCPEVPADPPIRMPAMARLQERTRSRPARLPIQQYVAARRLRIAESPVLMADRSCGV